MEKNEPLQHRLTSRLRAHRLRLGMTQEQLAERAAIPVESISRIENGRVPEIGTLESLAGALGVSMGEILDPEPGLGDLSESETELLRLFRQLKPDSQRGLISVLRETRRS